MPDAFEFTKILALSEEPALQRAAFRTEAGKSCSLKTDGPGEFLIKTIRTAAADDQALFVAYDADTRACRYVTRIIRDQVAHLATSDEPKPGLYVTLIKYPSILRLPRDHPRYDELARRLEQARAQSLSVWLGTYPGVPKIEDVYLPSR